MPARNPLTPNTKVTVVTVDNRESASRASHVRTKFRQVLNTMNPNGRRVEF